MGKHNLDLLKVTFVSFKEIYYLGFLGHSEANPRQGVDQQTSSGWGFSDM